MSAEFFWVSLLIALVAAPFLGMRKQWKTAGVLLGMASIVPASVFYAQLTDPTISQSDRQMGQLSLMIAAVSLLMSVGGFAAGWFIRSSQLRSGKQPAGESFR
jgi:EamA domain-containing membrane protein RarD